MTQPGTREIERPLLSRRDLLKAVPAIGLLAASAALVKPGTAATRTVTSTCRVCTGLCGLRATVRGDQIVRVEGDPGADTNGFICLHGLAIREMVHSRARVRRPLKRIGGSLVEISWDQALEEIAARLNAVRSQHGPRAVAVHTGWPLVGHPINAFLRRFCQVFGTPNFSTVSSLCNSARRIGQALTTGSPHQPDVNRSRTVVLWGANPSVSLPVWARAVAAANGPDRNLIVIDPVRIDLASRAVLHLPIRPGTDGALALGLMHVIVEEDLHDRAYIERYTAGFEQLRGLIARYDPARVADITSLRRDDIIRAARIIAGQGPTSIWTGLGIEHHENGLQTARAVTILAALCGDLAVRGGARLPISPRRRLDGQPLPCLDRPTTPRPVPQPVGARPIGYDEFPLYEAFIRQAQANLFTRAILEDEPYPLRALVLVGSNALVTAPDTGRLRRAAKKLSLLVSVDPFLTASGQLADYVLPAATFAEGTIPAPNLEPAVGRPLVQERYESRTDWAILTGLAAALGLDRFFPWRTLEEAVAAPHEPYMPDPAHTLLADRLTGSARPWFPSASGKIEIYSRTLERFGYDALPDWKEPSERPGRHGNGYPFILVTGPRTLPYVNSQFREIPSVYSKMPRPLAELHPEAARKAGISDGDRVTVVSPHGRIVLHAKVTTRVHPECVVVPAGWGGANANLLTRDSALDPVTGFPAFRSGICRLEPPPAT
jgi:anaerobic selenocysteine-containing dehydrogenase